jgi:hypothetical protein
MPWKPRSGQVAFIEPHAAGGACLTGVVLEDAGEAVVIDLGGSPGAAEAGSEVTASFFSPDALYRTEATLLPHDGEDTVIDLVIHDVERVQRRESPRTKVAVPIVLSNFDDPDPDAGGSVFASVTGQSIDIGLGGCRVATERRFPSGCDPTVTLHLSATEEVVALAAVLEEQPCPDGRFEYRLVFIDPEDDHQERLADIVADPPLEVAG